MAKQKYFTKTLTLPSGKRKYIRGKTKEELDKKVLQAKVELAAGVDISDHTTFGELAEIWFNAYKTPPKVRFNSAEVYRDSLERYILPRLGKMELRSIKPLHAQAVMQSIADKSRSIQSQVLQIMRAIFRLAVENGLIAKSPVIDTIKAGGAAPQPKEALTREQTTRLLDAIVGTRAYPFVCVLLYAGLRKGEALGLKWEDIDFTRGILHVRRSIVYTKDCQEGIINEELKTSAARRDIPIPLPLVAVLEKEKKKSKSEYVFSMSNGKHLSDASFRSLWEIITNRTTDDPEKLGQLRKGPRSKNVRYLLDFHVHPHLLRHTCITRWFEAGLDLKEIQYLAGHSTIEMTLRVYTHYDRVSREEETAAKIRAATPNFLVTLS